MATETDGKGLPTLSNAGPMALASSPSKSNVLAVRFLFVSAMRPCSTAVVCQRAATDKRAMSMESSGLPVLPFKNFLLPKGGARITWHHHVSMQASSCASSIADANVDGFTLDLYRCQ